MIRYVCFVVVLLVPAVADAQTPAAPADTLRTIPAARRALDCTGADGKPAPIPAGYDGVMLEKDADEPARLVKLGTLRHPKGMTFARGAVVLQYVIDTTGRLEPCTISAEAVSDVRLVPAALYAIQSTEFAPARRHGRPIRVLVRQTVRFDARMVP